MLKLFKNKVGEYEKIQLHMGSRLFRMLLVTLTAVLFYLFLAYPFSLIYELNNAIIILLISVLWLVNVVFWGVVFKPSEPEMDYTSAQAFNELLSLSKEKAKPKDAVLQVKLMLDDAEYELSKKNPDFVKGYCYTIADMMKEVPNSKKKQLVERYEALLVGLKKLEDSISGVAKNKI